MIILASGKWPSITAQDVGRIIGRKRVLKSMAWIFKEDPDLFEAQFSFPFLLVVRRVDAQLKC